MNIAEICQRIKLLIKQIFAAQKRLEDARANQYQKVPEAVNALKETVKEIARLQITSSGNPVIMRHEDKEIIWHREFGLAIKPKMGNIAPLSVEAGDFPVENLASRIGGNLEDTLNRINSQCKIEETRTQNLETLIKTLQNSREE